MKETVYILSLLLLCACQKQEDPAPSGANTFACQIEGQDFTPYLAPMILGTQKALTAGRIRSTGGLLVDARTSFDQLEIYLAAASSPGNYPLGYVRTPSPYANNSSNYGAYTSVPPFVPGVTDPNNLTPPTSYYTDATTTGSVTITRYDTVARVAGGTFEYTARAATGKLVHITNGKFDVKF